MLDPRVGAIKQALVGLGLAAQPVAFLSTAIRLACADHHHHLEYVASGDTHFHREPASPPSELVEAAAVDGATPSQHLAMSVCPHLKPGVVVMVLLSTFWTFNNFVYVWLTTGAGPGLYTNVMATEVYIKGFVDGRLGYSSAVGVVMAAIMTAFGLLYLRVIAQRELKRYSDDHGAAAHRRRRRRARHGADDR